MTTRRLATYGMWLGLLGFFLVALPLAVSADDTTSAKFLEQTKATAKNSWDLLSTIGSVVIGGGAIISLAAGMYKGVFFGEIAKSLEEASVDLLDDFCGLFVIPRGLGRGQGARGEGGGQANGQRPHPLPFHPHSIKRQEGGRTKGDSMRSGVIFIAKPAVRGTFS